jgi:hypothetical protein
MDNIKIDIRQLGWKVDETGSGPSTVSGFGVSGVEP